MMVFDLFLKGLLTGFLVSLPVGPLGILVIQRTANRNFKSGFYSGLGVALTDTFWALIAAFSLSFIITFLRQHQSAIQFIGAFILFLLGLSIFLSHPANALRRYKQRGSNPLQCFITAILVALSNPLVVLGYIGIFAGTNLVLDIHNPAQTLSFLPAFFLGASSWWLILTTTLNFFRHKFNLRILWWINKISGSLIMLLVVISIIVVLITGNPTL